jgi:hypothetical protein
MPDMEEGGWVSLPAYICRCIYHADQELTRQDRYVCVEPGYVHEFKTLKPGEEFLAQQVISIA